MDESEELEESEELVKATQISLHSIRNFLGSDQQLTLFNEENVKEFAELYGVNLDQEISRYGIDLTDLQQRMVEAILHGFTLTHYKGNLEPIAKSSHAKEKYPSGGEPIAYKNIVHLPRLKATQVDIFKWASINRKSIGAVEEALKALKHLGTAQYCFYYTRLAFDEEGNVKKDRGGGYQKEEVMAVDTLFTIKEIRSKKTGTLDYYEIIPSSIFLDQRESYFLLIPNNWREEVKRVFGQKKASSYTFRFLLFLRYQFELQRRRDKNKKEFVYKAPPEEIAIFLRMPESMYRRKKERFNRTLEGIYSLAERLGYLKGYERKGTVDVFLLNEEKYHMPARYTEKLLDLGRDVDQGQDKTQAKQLMELIIQEKRKLIPRYKPASGGQIYEQSLKHLFELLGRYSFDEIAKVIKWGINKQFWCTRIGTPSKLKQNFDEAFLEMTAAEKKAHPDSQEDYAKKNKDFCLAISQAMKEKGGSTVSVDVLSAYVEVLDGIQPYCLSYSAKGFRDQLEGALRKRGVFLDSLGVDSL